MDISGSLQSFSAAAVLNLLAQQCRTGVLSLVREGTSKDIFLSEGRIYSVQSNTNRKTLPDILIERGQLTREHLDRALSTQRKGIKLGQVLIRSGFVNRRQVYAALQVQMEDMVLEALAWQDGEFSFAERKFEEERLIPLNEVGRKFLEEGASAPEVLAEVVQELPDLDFFVRIVEEESRLFNAPSLTLDDYMLLALAGGRRTIRHILAHTRHDLLDTCDRLVGLRMDHLIEFTRLRGPMDDVALISERNRILTALILCLREQITEERRYHERMLGFMPQILPAAGGGMSLSGVPMKEEDEEELTLDDEHIGPDLSLMFGPEDEAPLEDGAGTDGGEPDGAFTPDEDVAETPVMKQVVEGTIDDAFPWFETASPQEALVEEPEADAIPDADVVVDDVLSAHFNEVGAVEPEIDAGVENAPSPPDKPAKTAHSRSNEPVGKGDEERFEMFMEDRVAQQVRYQKYKSEIKMAYNRITMRKLNYFEILDVQPSAPMRIVSRAYKTLIKRYDDHGILKPRDTEQKEMATFVMAKINEAYSVLNDPVKRRAYSETIQQQRKELGDKKKKALLAFHEGMSHYKDNEFEKARESFRKALTFDSNNPVYYNMMESLDHQEREKESVKFYQAGRLTFEKKGDVKRAIMLIRKAISIDAKGSYYQLLGDILAKDRSAHDDAIAAYEEALKMDPGNAQLHIAIGKMQMKRPSTLSREEALGHFVEALKWDELNIEAKTLRKELEDSGIKLKQEKPKKKQ
ncbi:DUF4388 domain-containing protein [bacterium]|nr:DUF4388 domain-containing protein [candidate division CSSED10-310 bacterium]